MFKLKMFKIENDVHKCIQLSIFANFHAPGVSRMLTTRKKCHGKIHFRMYGYCMDTLNEVHFLQILC